MSHPSEPVMLAPLSLACKLVEKGVNQYLRSDAYLLDELGVLSGKRLAVSLQGAGITLYLCFRADGVALTLESEDSVDVTVAGPPFTLLRALKDSDKQGDFGAEVTVTGDAGVLRQLQMLLMRLEIDWEEHLSRVVGDIAAHQLGNMGRAALAWGRSTGQTLVENLGEYLAEESRLVAATADVEAFATDIDDLRDDTERLDIRVGRLLRLHAEQHM